MSDNPFVLGLDLGQMADYTAVAVIELLPGRVYHCRHLQRFALGTDYTAIVASLREMLAAPALRGRCLIVADATGVGLAIVDSMRAADLPVAGVIITSGDTERGEGNNWFVPKRELVGVLRILLESGRLQVAPELPDSQTLTRELLAFRVKISAAGNDTYAAWREGAHDDLVLAVALACWFCERAKVQTYQVVSLPRVQLGPGY